MFALFVTIRIKPGRKDAFMEATMGDAEGSNKNEPGCLRFDVLQDNSDPNTVYLYEVYKERSDWEVAHRQTPHYLKWRETVGDWFDGDPVRVETSPVYPSGEGSWSH